MLQTEAPTDRRIESTEDIAVTRGPYLYHGLSIQDDEDDDDDDNYDDDGDDDKDDDDVDAVDVDEACRSHKKVKRRQNVAHGT